MTVSSLSKVLAPGLRIGFLRAPARLLGPLTVAKQAADLHTSTVDQHAARICLQTGELDDHIERICAEYRRRRDALLGGLLAALPEGSTHNHPDGGMFVWARLPEGFDATDLLRRALEHDVAFVPGAPFYATDPDARTLRLSFTTHRPEEIVEGLARLRAAAAAA
jgi:DNA-binding transcriptional MocR family regulator